MRPLKLFFLLAVAASLPAQQPPRVRVGPDILVTRDGDIAHAELWLAAHPTDASTQLGMSHTVRDAGSHVMLEMYTSHDGGQSWTGIVHPHELAKGGGDPIVGFSAQGTMLGVSLGDGGMWVYRSEDGGITWDQRRAGRGDHERLAVDFGTGTHGGRIYLAAEAGDGGRSTPDSLKRAVQLWRSNDDGRSWIGPVTVGRNAVGGIAVTAMTVLSDGTLAVFLQRYPNPGKDMTTPTWELQTATSTDGGVTFTTHPAGQIYFGGYADLRRRQGERLPDVWGPGSDAVADTKGTRFRDRIYMTYVETRRAEEGGRLVLRYSADHGTTWSPPRNLFPETRAVVSQFQPALAVNRDGTVGILWFDTRETGSRDTYHVYFAASTDGGETWSAPARLSSEASTPFAAGNIRPVPFQTSQTADGVRVSLFSAFGWWPNGGDYMGLAADADGVFHPFWTDARSGTFEIYTSRVEVPTIASTIAAAATPREQRTVNEQVTFVVDPVRVDLAKGELLVPVRLKNTSRDTLYPPFGVRVKSLAGPTRPFGKDDTAELLNASNGHPAVPGAEMDYAKSLRDLTALAPNAVTEAIVWRVKPANMRNTSLNIVADVTGSVRSAPDKR